ncbi:MAG: AhpC/TSA family protein [Flavobacteriales bacterium]|nr:AhpC/TSA family protein [Flavobacteriales bacterium]
MKLNFFVVLSITILLGSCQTAPRLNTITGAIEGAEGQTISLIGYNNGVPDTLHFSGFDQNGSFSFEFKAGRPDFYTLSIDKENSIILILDSTDSAVKIDGKFGELKESYSVSGSSESERLKNLLVRTTSYEKQLDSLMTSLRNSATSGKNEKRAELGNTYNKTREEYREYLLNFIEENPAMLANFTALQRLNMKEDLDQFVKVRNALSDKVQGNYFFDNLSEQIAVTENQIRLENLLKPGSEAPEIALPNPNGEIVKLSDYRGNYVLIDFWASWCRPCRMENPNVVRMYNKYEDKNFEILGVSLDKTKDKWVTAIEQDNLLWPHVSDLKFWQSAAAELYNVKSIPFTVLVDPDGKVIATKLRGKALEDKLDEIFNA